MSDIAERAKQGLLSRRELDDLADRMEHQETFEELGWQILAMQFAGDARYRRAIERYFDQRHMLSEVNRALQVLCFNWNLIEDYLDWVLSFIEGVDWDLRNGVQVVRSEAFILAGWYLRSNRSRELLGLVLRIARDETEHPISRGDAGLALMSASGILPQHVPLELALDDPRFAKAVGAAAERLPSEPDLPPRDRRLPVPHHVRIPDFVESLLPAATLRSALVGRARRDGLSRPELDDLARSLATPRPAAEVLEHLAALLYAGDARYRGAVEPLLDVADPEIAGAALLLLCSGWRLTADHLDRVARPLEHPDPSLRRIASTIAGTFLATRRSRRLLELLLRLAEDDTRPRDARTQALTALYRATDGFPGGLPETVSDRSARYALDAAHTRLVTE
jgi:hypothetical protein